MELHIEWPEISRYRKYLENQEFMEELMETLSNSVGLDMTNIIYVIKPYLVSEIETLRKRFPNISIRNPLATTAFGPGGELVFLLLWEDPDLENPDEWMIGDSSLDSLCDTIIHELLHLRYPDLDEDEIETKVLELRAFDLTLSDKIKNWKKRFK